MDAVGMTVPAIAAHRGWHADGARENTIEALERAAQGGAEWVENDVHELRDRTLVVHHDPQLSDGRLLADLDASELTRYPHVPTLDAWAKRAGELQVGALVERKDGDAARIVETLRQHVPAAKTSYMDFDQKGVAALRLASPDTPVGLLTDLYATDADGVRRSASGEELAEYARRVGASFLGLNVGQATEPVLAAAHGAGLGVAVWTANDVADIEYLTNDPRVTTIITDRPAVAQEARAAIAGTSDASAAVRFLRAAATMR